MNAVRSHALFFYYLLAFVISWGGVALLLGPIVVLDPFAQIGNMLPAVIVVTVLGPFIGGIAMTWATGGRKGIKDLFSRMTRRIEAKWYLALLIAPLSLAASLLILSFIFPGFPPGILISKDKVSALQFALMAGLIGGFFEEVGWTGFAVPRMIKRYGIYVSGVIMGFLWGLWHLLSNIWGSGITAGPVPLAIFLPVALFTFLPPYRVLMVWVYNNTKSLFLGILLHINLILFWLLFTPISIIGLTFIAWYLAWGAVLWLMAAIILKKA